MKRSLIIGILSLPITACAAEQSSLRVTPDSPTEPSGDDHDFDCTASAGAHNHWTREIVDHGTFAGTLHFRALDTTTEWFPMATVSLRDAERRATGSSLNSHDPQAC